MSRAPAGGCPASSQETGRATAEHSFPRTGRRTTAGWRPDEAHALTEVCESHGLTVRPCTRNEIAALFGSWRLLGDRLSSPTAVRTALRHAQLPPEESLICAGIALKTR